jgi:hypothetical protein
MTGMRYTSFREGIISPSPMGVDAFGRGGGSDDRRGGVGLGSPSCDGTAGPVVGRGSIGHGGTAILGAIGSLG